MAAWDDAGDLEATRATAMIVVSDGLAKSLAEVLPKMVAYPASVAQFSHEGRPYAAGETLRQPDLARSLERIAQRDLTGTQD